LRLFTDVKLLKRDEKLAKNSAIIFIDFTSAFDNVDWDILFKGLKKQNFPKRIINTFKLLYYNTLINGEFMGHGIP